MTSLRVENIFVGTTLYHINVNSVHMFRKINFCSCHQLRKYFYSENLISRFTVVVDICMYFSEAYLVLSLLERERGESKKKKKKTISL